MGGTELREARSEVATASLEGLADAIVAKICTVTRARTLQHTLEIGQIISQGVYEGRPTNEKGEIHPLYRRVATHHDLPFGPKRLWICVKIYGLVESFPGLRNASHLGVAHLRAVLALPAHLQERLLASAEKEHWTSERVEDEAAAFRRTSTNRGRPPTVALLRSIERIEKIAIEIQEDLGPRVRGKLTTERKLFALENLRRARCRLDSIEAELQRHSNSA